MLYRAPYIPSYFIGVSAGGKVLSGLVPSEYFITKIVSCIYVTNNYKYLVSTLQFCFEKMKETAAD